MNKSARDSLGMDLSTLRSKKCYELFGDGIHPCAYCKMLIPDDGSPSFVCKELKVTHEKYFIHGCAMTLNGKKYRTEQAVPAARFLSAVDLRKLENNP
jgi:hypothetical protein